MCCGVHFYRIRRYHVLYLRSIQAVLIMSVLWKKTEFYKGEGDREVMVSPARRFAEGAPPAGKFSHYGGPSFPLIFSSPHENLSSPLLLPEMGQWINSQGDFKKIFCLWYVFL